MRKARLWPLAAGTLLVSGCVPAISQAAAQNKAGAGLIWAGIILVLTLMILAVIRWLHARGAAWQVTYLGANLTAALGTLLLFTIIGTALLPAPFAVWATGIGAAIGTAWFVACAINLAPADSDGAGLFWFFLRPDRRSRRAPAQKQPQISPEPYTEELSSTSAAPAPFKSSSPAPALEPQQATYESPSVRAPGIARPVAPAVAMSAAPIADNQYARGSAAKPGTNPEDDRRCPHGHRRREYCPICDLEGFRENFGDWRTD